MSLHCSQKYRYIPDFHWPPALRHGLVEGLLVECDLALLLEDLLAHLLRDGLELRHVRVVAGGLSGVGAVQLRLPAQTLHLAVLLLEDAEQPGRGVELRLGVLGAAEVAQCAARSSSLEGRRHEVVLITEV